MTMMKRRDKGGRRDSGPMNSALDDLNFNDPALGSDQKKVKREPVNRTHFTIEFIWTPEKPRLNSAAEKGAVASAGSPSGAAVGVKAPPSAQGVPATTTTKK